MSTGTDFESDYAHYVRQRRDEGGSLQAEAVRGASPGDVRPEGGCECACTCPCACGSECSCECTCPCGCGVGVGT